MLVGATASTPPLSGCLALVSWFPWLLNAAGMIRKVFRLENVPSIKERAMLAGEVKVEGEPRAKDGPGRDRRAPGYTMDSRVGPKFLQQRTRSR
ncbi:hypothetical protein QR685DRAFT_509967 [Neurospora intermedia]|uniref:Uncharacterized protein n=1 Tax=Neurospora intermedia TaxID=5142 RepID=A0ABR3DPB0_NEUIN